MPQKRINIIVTMVDRVTGAAKRIETSTRKLRNGVERISKTYNRFGSLIAEKTKFTREKENLTAFAKRFNKLGGVMGMGQNEFRKFDDGTGRLNKRMMKQLGVMGRLGMRVRWLTHGFRGFRMELLGVMFFGMGIQKFFTGLIKPALTVTGVFKLWSTILTILFLPIALKLLDWTIKFMDWMNKSERLQKFIRWITVIGVVIGSLLFFIGMFGLGIGSLLVAFSVVISPIIAVIGALFTFLASMAGSKIGILALIAAFVGLVPSVSATGEGIKKQGGIWNTLKTIISAAVSKIIGFLDMLWDKFLEIPLIQTLVQGLGIDLDKLRNPIKWIRDKVKTLWAGFIKDFPEVKTFLDELKSGFPKIKKYINDLITDAKDFIKKLIPEEDREAFKEFIEEFGKFAEHLKDLNITNLNNLLNAMTNILDVLNKSIEGWKWWIAGIKGEGGIGDLGATFKEKASEFLKKGQLNDFIMKGNTITPINPADTIVGFKGESPLPSPEDMFRTPFEPVIKVIIENNTDAIVRVTPQSV